MSFQMASWNLLVLLRPKSKMLLMVTSFIRLSVNRISQQNAIWTPVPPTDCSVKPESTRCLLIEIFSFLTSFALEMCGWRKEKLLAGHSSAAKGYLLVMD